MRREPGQPTDDRITVDAAHAIGKFGVAVKSAGITPDKGRMDELHLKRMYTSPNGTLRNRIGGTVFREPIVCQNVPRIEPNSTQSIVIGRHAFADQYAATDFAVPGAGTLTMTFTPRNGGEPVTRKAFDFPDGGVAMGMYNLDEPIKGFARLSFNYGLQCGWPGRDRGSARRCHSIDTAEQAT